jgi:hypothetical protein
MTAAGRRKCDFDGSYVILGSGKTSSFPTKRIFKMIINIRNCIYHLFCFHTERSIVTVVKNSTQGRDSVKFNFGVTVAWFIVECENDMTIT